MLPGSMDWGSIWECRLAHQTLQVASCFLHPRMRHSIVRHPPLAYSSNQVRTPAIKWEATSRRVLTMEWIEGVKLTDKVRL